MNSLLASVRPIRNHLGSAGHLNCNPPTVLLCTFSSYVCLWLLNCQLTTWGPWLALDPTTKLDQILLSKSLSNRSIWRLIRRQLRALLSRDSVTVIWLSVVYSTCHSRCPRGGSVVLMQTLGAKCDPRRSTKTEKNPDNLIRCYLIY